MNYKELLEENLREYFPLYKNEHKISEHEYYNFGHFIYYRTNSLTQADLKIKNSIAEICFLEITPKKQGYGTMLYTAIEKFFKQIKCKAIRLLSYEESEQFWEKRGFQLQKRMYFAQYKKDIIYKQETQK